MIDVSILIPVYNVRDYIIRCLDSVAQQTYNGSIECIIVDDCGNDGSILLAEEFISNYNGPISFRIIHHNHNRGLAAARNTAVVEAKGVFVFHLDSDDWLEPRAIELLIQKQKETDADIVSGNALKHSKYGNIILSDPSYQSKAEMVHHTIEMLIDHVIWRRLIRRCLYTDNNITAVEGVNMGEDHHTLPRLAYYAKSVASIDEVVYNYNCMNPNSYMAQGVIKFNFAHFDSNNKCIDILQDFFSDKDLYCVNRLKDIRGEYVINSVNMACSIKDKFAYIQLCKKAGIKPRYWIDRFNLLYRRVSNKLSRLF